jgi:hypothetical protein
MDELPVDLLKPNDQHWAVGFLKDGSPDLHNVVRADRKEVAIERRVVKFAEGYPIAYERLALKLGVGGNVRCVKEIRVSKSTEGASLRVGSDDALTECHLVQSSSKRCRDIGTSGLCHILSSSPHFWPGAQRGEQIIDLNREPELVGEVLNDECRVGSHIASGLDRVEVDDRNALEHGPPKAAVVSVTNVDAAVGVLQDASAWVRPVVICAVNGCCDRNW